MKVYYCDFCDKNITNIPDRNKIKITECWDNSTYRFLLCENCLSKVFDLLKGDTYEK